MTNLKPCPFCGGEVEIDMLDSEQNRNVKIYNAVHCPECHQWFFKGLSREKTIAAWNRRPNQWIPVSERLPKVDKYGDIGVLVHMDDGFISTATYDKNNGWELWADAGEVTHWMPLPLPLL